jgi:type IV pilus assembly protein PilC
MAHYTFRAATSAGVVQTLEVDGESSEAARRSLEAQGYLVFDGGAAPRTAWRLPRLRPGRIGARALLIFNQELLALVRAGLPILATLDLLKERSQLPLLRKVLADARETVRGGAALSVALAQFPRHFPPLFTAALQAGEQSGNFTDALARYVEYQRRLLALRQRMRAALTYPVILTVASFAVIVFLLAFVVPTFTRIYEDMEGQLPVATRMLVHATGSLRAALPLALGLVALAAAGIWRWRRTPTGEEITDRILLRFPWVGSVLAGYQYSRFARTLAMMQAGGIPMIPSLEATLSVVRNRHLASRIRTALPHGGRPAAHAGTDRRRREQWRSDRNARSHGGSAGRRAGHQIDDTGGGHRAGDHDRDGPGGGDDRCHHVLAYLPPGLGGPVAIRGRTGSACHGIGASKMR